MSLLVPAPVAGQSWKGINYYPRGHQFYNMLNDWYNYDANAGGYYVRNSVINDMALLHSNGVNFLHLYLWDSQFYGTGFNPMCGVLTHGKSQATPISGQTAVWKQTKTPQAGWQDAGFDDSSWQWAVDEGAVGTAPWGTLVGMPNPTLARWIWEYDSRSGNDTDTVYFRRTFYSNQASQTLHITADNSFTVYINGVAVGSGNNWQTVYAFPVTLNIGPTLNVIGVSVTNAGGPGGFIADLRGSLVASQSPNAQWSALDDFLGLAESSGLNVGLHFVSQGPIELLNGGIGAQNDLAAASQMGNIFEQWEAEFVNYFSARHANISMWGLAYALGPAPDAGGRANVWNEFFATAYEQLAPLMHSTAPGVGNVAINLSWPYLGSSDGYSYSWDWQKTQRAAQAMRDMQLSDPDIYMLQLYNANSADIERDLMNLSRAASPGGMSVPSDKILAVEFATSSSVAPPPYGNGVPSKGDADTPTTDLAGQAQWLNNSLCAFDRAGLSKLAYFGMYDAADFWQGAPFNNTGAALAWGGYWGFFPVAQGGAAKPAWSTLGAYYLYGVANPANLSGITCVQPAPPVITLTANTTSVTPNQPVTLTWTAAEVTSLSLTGVGAVSQSLNSTTVYPSFGSTTYTLSAWNGGVPASASVTVTVTSPPPSISSASYAGASGSNSYITIYGANFGLSNYVSLSCASATITYQSASQINVSFPTPATGTYCNVQVYSYTSGLWSNTYYNVWVPGGTSPPAITYASWVGDSNGYAYITMYGTNFGSSNYVSLACNGSYIYANISYQSASQINIYLPAPGTGEYCSVQDYSYSTGLWSNTVYNIWVAY